MKDDFSPDEYLNDLVAALVNETFNIIDIHEKEHGTAFAHKLSLSLVRNMVMVMVFRSISEVPSTKNATPEMIQKAVEGSFQNMRDDLQNAIADGFEGAFRRTSGQEMNYYCKIKPAGLPINTLEI